MSYLPTQGNEVLVNTPGGKAKADPRGDLVSWLVSKADRWERIRDQGPGRYWPEYWRTWRGMWAQEDQTKKSERSRIITPALAQAVEMTVSELEEAAFSRERWIDVANPTGPEAADMSDSVTTLLEDLELVNAKDAVSEAVQNGAIFGQCTIKVCTDVITQKKATADPTTGAFKGQDTERAVVYWESIRPDELIPDPAGRTISEMLGVFHNTRRPLHAVLEKIESGAYSKAALSTLRPAGPVRVMPVDKSDPGVARNSPTDTDECEILEYHGKVPAKLLFPVGGTVSKADQFILADLQSRPTAGDGPLVEAIVTIGNRSTLLRAMVNPFEMKDRSIVSWSHERVPGRFWGRGVCEKGINSQRALDAEVRARIDSLGFISAPMMGVDVNRMQKGFSRTIFPGKVWATNGPPAEILQTVKVGELNANTFNQAADMERMVQMATGAFDTGSALGRGQTSSGGSAVNAGSLFMGAFVKRSKRAFQNLDRNALKPLIEKTLWRYMEFAPSRYPVKNYDFVVKGSLGIVAREVEQLNLTQTMAMLPETAVKSKVAIAEGIVEMATVHNKAKIMAALQEDMAGPTPEAQKAAQEAQAIQIETLKEELNKLKATNKKLEAEAALAAARSQGALRQAETEDDKVEIEKVKTHLQAVEIDQFGVQNQIAAERLALQHDQLQHKKAQDAKSSK